MAHTDFPSHRDGTRVGIVDVMAMSASPEHRGRSLDGSRATTLTPGRAAASILRGVDT